MKLLRACTVSFALLAALTASADELTREFYDNSVNEQAIEPRLTLDRSVSKTTVAYDSSPLLLASSVLVIDQESGDELYAKNADQLQSIASITKLMTAIVVLEARQPLYETIQLSKADVVLARPTGSRLKAGMRLSRGELLRLMLMASENRAAAALARSFPGGLSQFVRRMNETAAALGLLATNFADPTGLRAANISTARDLVNLVQYAYRHPLIREYSTTPEYAVSLPRARRAAYFRNTNRLTRRGDWDIGLSKTGYIGASGHCLVLQTNVAGRPVVMVILDSWGSSGRVEDAVRIRDWVESNHRWVLARAG